MATATLVAPPKLPRSITLPSFFHSTACVAIAAQGPDAPTISPPSLIPSPALTVSPATGESRRLTNGVPSDPRLQTTPSKSKTWGDTQLPGTVLSLSFTPFSE